MGDEEKSIKLPQFSEREIFAMLLSEDLERGDEEPAIASGIAVQMQHMELDAIPLSMRARIRDISGKLPTSNAVLVGGGIGYLAAWLLDLWCGDPANPPKEPPSRPDSFRIIEPGGKFGVIINRLIGRHNADSWTQVITKQWQEVVAETISWSAATTTLPASANPYLLPTPLDLVIIDVPEYEISSTASTAFKLLSQGGIMIVQEPKVPTGDVGVAEPGSELTLEQRLVESFNSWIDFVKQVSETHSLGFVELEGGTLAVFRK
ncbi:MAG: hypothetical protein QF807_04320 [Candidatus Thalassarchaeaceae archaeon]|jgi:hypothetical protein|nr:hypothetical protein [Candidatus Thalassarchaeaceae archaeon]MDP7043223.1 hypothetical protein [Candidatus Thalassarchaeaceae archaeon]